MADDLLKCGRADQSRIKLEEHHEVDYWTRELGVTETQLRELIRKHGSMAMEIREALGKA